MFITRNANLSELVGSKEGKKRIYDLFKVEETDGVDFCERHSLNYKSFMKFKRKLELLEETGVDSLHDSPGRPPLFDESSKENIQQTILNRNEEQKSFKKSQTADIFLEEVREVKRRRGEVDDASISKETLRKYVKEFDIEAKVGQFKTKARITAEADPRNAYTMFAMASAFCEDLSPLMIGNWVATQFVADEEEQKLLLTIKNQFSKLLKVVESLMLLLKCTIYIMLLVVQHHQFWSLQIPL
jgi:hypothetical protein